MQPTKSKNQQQFCQIRVGQLIIWTGFSAFLNSYHHKSGTLIKKNIVRWIVFSLIKFRSLGGLEDMSLTCLRHVLCPVPCPQISDTKHNMKGAIITQLTFIHPVNQNIYSLFESENNYQYSAKEKLFHIFQSEDDILYIPSL